jgi:hypothetical protein
MGVGQALFGFLGVEVGVEVALEFLVVAVGIVASKGMGLGGLSWSRIRVLGSGRSSV